MRGGIFIEGKSQAPQIRLLGEVWVRAGSMQGAWLSNSRHLAIHATLRRTALSEARNLQCCLQRCVLDAA
jgi:hypothetical protein